MAIIRAPEVPLIPSGDTLRVAVKINKKLYRQAQALNIDIHTFWRTCLQQAVDALQQSPVKSVFNWPDHDWELEPMNIAEVSERIKGAAERAAEKGI